MGHRRRELLSLQTLSRTKTEDKSFVVETLPGEANINTFGTPATREFGQVRVTNAPRNLLDRRLGYFIANSESDTENAVETRLRRGRSHEHVPCTYHVAVCLRATIVCSCTIPAQCFCVYPFNDYHCNNWDLRD